MLDVTISAQFTLELEAQLGYERSDERPSIKDFEQYDMPAVLRFFALNWSLCLPVSGDSYYRYFLAPGLTVPAYAVRGHMMSDGRIELVSSSIDWDFDPVNFD